MQADPGLQELVFETAWFGRNSFVLLGEPAASDVLAALAGMLDRRRSCRARASRTVDVIWALDAEPDPAISARLAAATNIRWLRLQPAAPASG